MELDKSVHFTKNNSKYLFRSLSVEDVTESYVQALKRQRIFLTNNPEDIHIQWQQKYVRDIISSPHNTICGLFNNSDLIGTAGIQNIKQGQTASFGIFVLDEKSRGKGYGKTLVWATCFILNECNSIMSFRAGMEKANIASLKSFLSCGFRIFEENERYIRVKMKIDELIKPDSMESVFLK